MLMNRPGDLNLTSSLATIQFARIFSNVVSPPSIFALLGLVVAWATLPFWPGLAWAAMYGFLISLVPLGVIIYLLKTGRVSDLHMRNKNERHIPYLVGLICAVLALVVTSLLGAPDLLSSLIVCNIIGLVTLGFINMYWLISSHTASIMLATLFIGFVISLKAAIALVPIIGLTIFARLVLRRHTVPQLVVGLLAGAAPVLILAYLGYLS
jgi:hypothetical protein